MPETTSEIVIWRNIAFLRGVAILAVVANHAVVASWTLVVSSHRGDSPAGSPAASALMVLLRNLTPFCVPAFFLAAGFMIHRFPLGLMGATKAAFRTLRIYLLWSILVTASFFLLGMQDSLGDSVRRLLLGNPLPTYWFLLVIAELYFLSPLLVRIIDRTPLAAAILAVTAESLDWTLYYLDVNTANWPLVVQMLRPIGMHLPFFIGGMFVSRWPDTIVGFLCRFRWAWAGILMGTVLLAVGESLIAGARSAYHPTIYGRMFSGERASMALSSLAVVGWLISRPTRDTRWSRWFSHIGLASLGILLLTDLFRIPLYALLWHLPEWLELAHIFLWPPLFLVTLVAFVSFDLLGPLWFMRVVNRALGRRAKLLW